MILDIIIGAILLITGVHGIRKGFVNTFIHTAGWIMSLVLAFIVTPYAKTYIMENTTLYDKYIPKIAPTEGLPEVLQNVTVDLTNNFIFTVIVYLALFIALKIVLTLLLTVFSKDYRHGMVGFFDGFLGLILGLITGIILVFVFLAVMIPLADSFKPELVPQILSQLESSYIAKTLYDNNFLLVVLQNFFVVPLG